MDVSELIEIALAGVDPSRVEIGTAEPAGVGDDAVDGVARVVAELVGNAIGFSDPGQTVTVQGAFEASGYVISITDRGVGISETLLSALNRILESPAPSSGEAGTEMGITSIARIAARLGLEVRLMPGSPGTTARVILPLGMVTRPSARDPEAGEVISSWQARTEVFAPDPGPMVDLTRYETGLPSEREPMPSMSADDRRVAEDFLETVFGPLRGRAATGRDRPGGRVAPNLSRGEGRDPAPDQRPPVEREPRATTSTLRVRVPGTNFSVMEDDQSVASSEGAIDIRSALSRYELGRRNAARSAEKPA